MATASKPELSALLSLWHHSSGDKLPSYTNTQSHKLQRVTSRHMALAAVCRSDPAAPREPGNGLKHIHKVRLNEAGLQPRSPAPGDAPGLGLLLINLDALLLHGFSPHCL